MKVSELQNRLPHTGLRADLQRVSNKGEEEEETTRVLDHHAATVAERGRKLRAGFAGIFDLTGYQKDGFGIYTPRIVVAKEQLPGQKKQPLQVVLRSNEVIKPGQKPSFWRTELRATLGALVVPGGGERYDLGARAFTDNNFGEWATRWAREAGSHYDGPAADLGEAYDAVQAASATQEMILGALADTELNPQFAHIAEAAGALGARATVAAS